MGLWHLGTVASGCLAELGYSVVGVDPDGQRVARLNSGTAPVFEPRLEDLIRSNLAAGRLRFASDFAEGVRDADCVIFAYDTPVDANDEVDLGPLMFAAERIARGVREDTLVVVQSQVPVGTCAVLEQVMVQHNPQASLGIVCVPENLRLGQAVARFMAPDMLIIGADDDEARRRAEDLFSVVSCAKLHTSVKTAEMSKHALNAFFATCISFANELGNLCDEVGADGLKVAEAMRLDARVGPHALVFPGSPFGGGTLARDLKVLQHLGESSGYETMLVDAVLNVNERQKTVALRQLNRLFGSLKGLRIGVLGLTYKAGTSTLRRSQAVEIVRKLLEEGASVSVFDPKADMSEFELATSVTVCRDALAVAEGADALVIGTEWPEFIRLDFQALRARVRRAVVVDTKNLLAPDQMSKAGFSYFGVGRGFKPSRLAEA